MSTTDFLCALVITNFRLKYVQAPTTNLQAESRDIVSAVRLRQLYQQSKMLEKTYKHHAKWFLTVESMQWRIQEF